MDVTKFTTNQGEWNEAEHPRVPAGTAAGGQFTGGGEAHFPGAAPTREPGWQAPPAKPESPTAAEARRAREWNAAHPNEPQKPTHVSTHEMEPSEKEPTTDKEPTDRTPTPATETPESSGHTPTEEEPESVTPTSWDELSPDQQEKAKDRWMDANRSAYIADEVNQWREDESNFDHVSEEVAKDNAWVEDKIKEINNTTYAGEPTSDPAEEEQRINDWHKNFAMDDSYKNGAFSVDESGKLEVNTDKLVFRDNPYADSNGNQRMLPGIDREELSSHYKASRWKELNGSFEKEFSKEFDEETQRRIDELKDNPPDWIGDNANEFMDEQWEMMDSDDKFRHAQSQLSDLGHVGGGGERPTGKEGTLGPDEKFDSKEQKAIQGKLESGKPTSKHLGGGVSETRVVTMPDGSKYVWKPSNGEANVRSGVFAGEQYQREVAAYDIGKLVGMKSFMPVTSIVKYDGTYGAMMEMIPHASNDGSSGDKNFTDNALRGTFFDYILGNTDRHSSNYMSDDKGKLWLIDNGLSLSRRSNETARFGLWRGVVAGAAGAPLGGDVIPESIKKPWKGKWAKIKAVMERRGIDEKAIAHAEKRYNTAISDGVTWRQLGVDK